MRRWHTVQLTRDAVWAVRAAGLIDFPPITAQVFRLKTEG
jgi:hypothetical protein